MTTGTKACIWKLVGDIRQWGGEARFAAPGVMLTGPASQGRYVQRSGTSVAAAQTAGAVALLMEWAVVRKNAPYLNGTSAKNYLTRAAARDEGMTYPNPDWGYGKLDLYRVFELLV